MIKQTITLEEIDTKFHTDNLNFRNRDFSGLDIQFHVFDDCDLRGSDFTDANLSGCTFAGTQAQGCDFTNVMFNHATFVNTRFDGSIMRRASFQEAEFDHVSFDGCDLTGAVLDDSAQMDEHTQFSLSRAKEQFEESNKGVVGFLRVLNEMV